MILTLVFASILTCAREGHAWILMAPPSCICTRSSTHTVTGSYLHSKNRCSRLFMNQDDDSLLSPWLGNSALVSTLAQLNRKWEASSSTGYNKWRKLFLTESDDPTNTIHDNDQQKANPIDSDFVYVLEPTSHQPAMILLFTGGAILGQTPHISYSYFLESLSRELNATIIASPYSISLDHWSLARQILKSYQRALLLYHNGNFLNEDESSSTIPIYTLSHSLGSKLLILSCAASPGFEALVKGHIFLCFNNFGFSQTISMAKVFSEYFQQGRSPSAASSSDTSWLNRILDMTKQAMDMVGLEFSPTPQETLQIIQKKFSREIQAKTQLYVMDQDSLDCSTSLLQSCRPFNDIAVQQEDKDKSDIITTSTIPGTHLTPVFLQVDVNDFNVNIPNINMNEEWVSSLLGGFRGVSFGNEEQTKTLIEQITKSIQSKVK